MIEIFACGASSARLLIIARSILRWGAASDRASIEAGSLSEKIFSLRDEPSPM